MSGAVTAIPQLSSVVVWSAPGTSSGTHQRQRQRQRPSSLIIPRDHHPFCSSSTKLLQSGSHKFPTFNLSCNSLGDSGPGNNDSRTILDAFLLGKAVAEAVNERVESAVGEFLSTVGRLQAEQQKQVQEFQEEVLEKVRRAKELAAREALEAQGQVSESTTTDRSIINGFAAATSRSKPNNGDPLLGMMLNDD